MSELWSIKAYQALINDSHCYPSFNIRTMFSYRIARYRRLSFSWTFWKYDPPWLYAAFQFCDVSFLVKGTNCPVTACAVSLITTAWTLSHRERERESFHRNIELSWIGCNLCGCDWKYYGADFSRSAAINCKTHICFNNVTCMKGIHVFYASALLSLMWALLLQSCIYYSSTILCFCNRNAKQTEDNKKTKTREYTRREYTVHFV